MRPHGRASIDPRRPRAVAICQRCGAMYNHDQLRWQFEYGGMRLINLRVLVCQSCLDTPQIQLRTILLPPDPIPIEFPLPEVYTATDNPISPIGFSPNLLVSQTYGANIGNLTYYGGLNAAFDGAVNKQSFQSAAVAVSNSSYQNFIGKNWGATVSAAYLPTSIVTPVSYEISSFSIYAPSDVGFFPSLSASVGSGGAFSASIFDANVFDTVGTTVTSTAGGLLFQGSSDGATWTTLYSTTIAGTAGETVTSVSSNLTLGAYQQHRFAFYGNGATLAVAQAQLNTDNTGQNEQ